MSTFFLRTLFVSALFFPAAAFAQEYQLLAPIPFLQNLSAGSGGIVAYLNALFDLSVLIGAVIAVFRIAAGGLQYMTTDAIGKKKDGLQAIQSSLLGLVMLLSIWIFFNQINPDILKLEGIDLEPAQTSSSAPSGSTNTPSAAATFSGSSIPEAAPGFIDSNVAP